MDIGNNSTPVPPGVEYAINVAKKAKEIIEDKGVAILKLINSAATVADASGASAGVVSKGSSFETMG